MAKRREEAEEEFDFRTYVKGLIAVLVTILIVVIIVMLFAKSLLSTSGTTKAVKTGHLTETAAIDVEAIEAQKEKLVEMTTTTAKKSSDDKDDDDDKDEEEEDDTSLPDGLDTSVAGEYTVNSAVYLHPEPNSSSENLATLPSGAEVTVYGNSNYGWYYLEYDGQFGYAWNTYLTKK